MALFSPMMPAILAFFAAPFAAMQPTHADQDRLYAMSRTTTFEGRNAASDTYEIMVAWPEGVPPTGGWPVLYVLDGEDDFPVAVVTARRLARAGARGGIMDGIVVGIGAGPLARRVRDYTPLVPGYFIPAGQPASGFETGGAEAFLDMLEGQVMPAVRQRWPVDQRKEMIVGHSFGGLLVIHALLTRPRMFDAAVAISPSLWFGGGVIDQEAEGSWGEAPRRLLMAEGDERRPSNFQLKSPRDLTHHLQTQKPTMEATFLQLPGQSHGTTFLAAIAPAIHFAFGKAER